MKELNKLN